MPDKGKLRLDELLVERGLYPSRSRARDAILRNTVKVSGKPELKPARIVERSAEIDIGDEARSYVSRAALKLAQALDHFAIDPAGCHCLDIGASTGGFTELLLERGAAHVTAIDVGHGQMAQSLVEDARVSLLEGLNARDLDRKHLAYPVELIVCDVSFISLRLALPPALGLAEPGAFLVALIKPQFEVGRDGIGKGGLVRPDIDLEALCRDIEGWIGEQGWQSLGVIPSPVTGGDGNREFLMAARKSG